MDDLEDGTPFVGRLQELEDIKTRLEEGQRMLLLHGQAMVGKARLAIQVAKDIGDEKAAKGRQPPAVYVVDCKTAIDWPHVLHRLSSVFGLDRTFTDEKELFDAVLKKVSESRENEEENTSAKGVNHATGSPIPPSAVLSGGRHGAKSDVGSLKGLLLLLKLQNFSPRQTERLIPFLSSLAKQDVATIMTSTSRRQLRVKNVIHVKPMSDNDVSLLLSQEAPDVNVRDFAGVLKYCHGLPPLVIQMAELVKGDPATAYTVQELKELLKERDAEMLMEEFGTEAEVMFSRLKPEVKKNVTTLTQLLAGTFSVEALEAALDVEGAKTKFVLRSMCDEAVAALEPVSEAKEKDPKARQVHVDPFIVYHVRKMGYMDTDDQARQRVVTFVGNVLIKTERELYLEDQDTVHGYLSGDWSYLQHVLRQAIHCTDNTYPAYIKVALEAEKLLVKCYPEEATQFFRKMAAVAVRFGTPREQAALEGLIGSAITQSAAMTEWKEAMERFHHALPKMREDKRSLALPRLLCSIGSAYFRQSKFEESEKYLKEALEVCKQTDADVDKVIFTLIQIRSLLALPLIFTGQNTEAKKLLEETLELCDSHEAYKHHPHKPVIINSLGLVYERSGESQEQALNYYLSSLAERRRYMKVASRDLVPPLNNIGMQYAKRGLHGRAIKHLEEAETIMGETKHYSTALTQQHLAEVCLQNGQFERAEKHLEKADRVYEAITPQHDVRAKVALFRAHVYVTSECYNVTKVREFLRQACVICGNKDDTLGDVSLLALTSAIEHLMQVDGWRVTSKFTGDMLEWTLQQLRNYKGDKSQRLQEHQSILEEAAKFVSDFTDGEKELLTSRVVKGCQQCTALEGSDDARELWRRVEDDVQSDVKLREKLQNSDIIKTVLRRDDRRVEHDVQSDVKLREKLQNSDIIKTILRRDDRRDEKHAEENEENDSGDDDGGGGGEGGGDYGAQIVFTNGKENGEICKQNRPCSEKEKFTKGTSVLHNRTAISKNGHLLQKGTKQMSDQDAGEAISDAKRLSTFQASYRPPRSCAEGGMGLERLKGRYQPPASASEKTPSTSEKTESTTSASKTRTVTSSATQTDVTPTKEEEHLQQQQKIYTEQAERVFNHSLSSPAETEQRSVEGNQQEILSSLQRELLRQKSFGAVLSQLGDSSGASAAIGSISGGSFTNCFNSQPTFNITISSVRGSVEFASSYTMTGGNDDSEVTKKEAGTGNTSLKERSDRGETSACAQERGPTSRREAFAELDHGSSSSEEYESVTECAPVAVQTSNQEEDTHAVTHLHLPVEEETPKG